MIVLLIFIMYCGSKYMSDRIDCAGLTRVITCDSHPPPSIIEQLLKTLPVFLLGPAVSEGPPAPSSLAEPSLGISTSRSPHVENAMTRGEGRSSGVAFFQQVWPLTVIGRLLVQVPGSVV